MKWLDHLTTVMGDGCYSFIAKLDKYQPEIFLGLGIIGMGLTIVDAVRKTQNLNDILDKRSEQKAEAEMLDALIDEYGVDMVAESYKETMGIDEEYVKNFDLKNQMLGINIDTGLKLVKNYWSTAALLAVSSASVLYSYKVLDGRYLGAVAAFNAVSEAFKEQKNEFFKYRARVLDKMTKKGTDAMAYDHYFRTGNDDPDEDEDEWAKINENDDIHIAGLDGSPKDRVPHPPKELSPYFKYFGPESKAWTGNPNTDILTLRGCQNFYTDRLLTKNHVTLNEVYDALGFEWSASGVVVGWVKGNGDNCVDLGLKEIENDASRTIVLDDGRVVFVIDFNVDGEIWDKI